jgi:hypothetical protein
MATQSKICDACGVTVTYTGHRGYGPAHKGKCSKEGTSAVDADHKACPSHGILVWIVGPYSTFRTCHTHCQAGKRGKPWRYCAPRGVNADGEDSNDNDNANDNDESDDMNPPSTPTPNNVTPDVQSAVAQLLNALQPKGPAVDMAAVESLVNKAVDAKLQATSRVTLVVERPNVESKVEIDSPHPYVARVIKLVEAGLPVYLWGPAGGGKTTAGMQVAKALGRTSEIDTLDPSTFRSMVQGYMTPTGDPVHTSFTRCWQRGLVYIADECDNAPGHVQTLYNSALANGHAPLAWGNAERGETFGFIGTGNTPGRPTREFPDRKPMSAAFADRLYFVHWPLDEQGERMWSGVGGKSKRQIPSVTPRQVNGSSWVDFVQNLREWAQTNAPTLMITPRASITGLKALACGETPEQVADGLIFRGADAELRAKALNAVKLP